MSELKTKKNKGGVRAFLNSTPDAEKRKDAFALLKLMQEVTGEKPAMWGTSIVGFGQYHYKSERSTQEGDWPLTGFSPRKQNLTLYIMSGFKGNANLLKKLGRHAKSSGSCLYIKHLKDVHMPTLKKIVERGYKEMKKRAAL